MKIIVLNDFAWFNGGASKIALGSAVALAGRGHSVTLFAAVGPVAPELLLIEGLQIICLNQYEIVDDPNRIRAVAQGFWNLCAEARIAELLANQDPSETVVHLHMWTKALSGSVVRAALHRGFRIVMSMHDYFAACPSGTFFNHPQQKICRLTPMSAACVQSDCDSRSYGHKLWRVGRQWIQKRIGHIPFGITDFISISDLSEQVMTPFLPANATIHRVRNFIDSDETSPVDVEANSSFVFSGRLSPEKGPLLLAQAVRELDLPTVFVGDGPLRSQIESLAPAAKVSGWLSGEAAKERLRSARALVFPSLWYETQGLVVAEAAALGVPAVVPDTCAAREWVLPGETGLWFHGGDLNDLKQKLQQLHLKPAVAAAMGRKAFETYWRDPPTLAKHCEQLEQVYGGMLAISSTAATYADLQKGVGQA